MSISSPVIAYLKTCGDTVTSCYQRQETNCLYLDGLKPPHYPVPALRSHLFPSNVGGRKGLILTHENRDGTLTIDVDIPR